MQFTVTSSQLLGPRSEQEDSLLSLPEHGLFAVADGMGGMEQGKLASRAAAYFLEHAQSYAAWDSGSCESQMRQLLHECNRAVREALQGAKGGTTLSVLKFFAPGVVCVGHVGDSRIYRIRGGRCQCLTEDHSVVAVRLRDGQLTPEQAYANPYLRNALCSSVGTDKTLPLLQAHARTWRPGDVFVLCSDGFDGAIEGESKATTHAEANRFARAQLVPMVKQKLSAAEMNYVARNTFELKDNSTVMRVDVTR